METQEFKHPRDDRWGYRLAIALCAVVALVSIWASFRSGNFKHALAGLVLGGGGIWYFIWQSRQIVDRVVVSDQGIDAVSYSGKCVRLNWTEVQEIVRFNMTTQTGPVKIVRLVAFDKSKQVVLTGRMHGFDELVQHIHAKTPHARTDGKPTLWERFAWGAKS